MKQRHLKTPRKRVATFLKKKIFSSKKKALSLLVLFIIILNVSVTAYALSSYYAQTRIASADSASLVNPNRAFFPLNSKKSPVKRNHAPEPTSLALLGSTGILGMIVRFARRQYQRAKRGFDIAACVVGLVVASPLLLIAMALIKLTSKGPIFYTQQRVGQQGTLFNIIKLRTMVLDAEKGIGAVWAQANDSRITPIGKVLRKTHIDEIPQLINVLRGDMSLIGPRPERPEFVKDLSHQIRDYQKRLVVKPGITGLAQVRHKYDETIEDVKRKIRYDLLYIKKMCWLEDFRILLLTCLVVITGKGAR